ncbi:MFS transporter [Nocardiopsis suaedae]|uniref:MFS transporter n=1 Tax=Nocardiopsis suaedae TaxID=3018444 RepID=A0ABT4TR47_9ACTN|nr:MFS transporter [Nocardiopsis suaedae]MDA2806734.1 MFS transporter [Nocardiopsis suaedae]
MTISRRTPPAAPDAAASAPPDPGIGRGLLFLMSAATGLAVAGNYLAHPLLERISGALGTTPAAAALIVTAAQAGYGAGLLLVVPLADIVERRRLAVGLLAAAAAGLAASAAAPSLPVLLATTVATASASAAAQVLVGTGAGMAAPGDRGRVVGAMMSGLLTGVLLARVVSGALAEAGGWTAPYWAAALLLATAAAALRLAMPRSLPAGPGRPAYPALLASTVGLPAREPVLRRRGAMAALSSAGYMGLWTGLALLLGGPDYGWPTTAIGLFGLQAAAGPVASQVAGRLADRGHVRAVTAAGAAAIAAAWAVLSGAAGALPLLVAGLLLADVGQQLVLNSSQNVLYALRPEARNRINSVFMTMFFGGGALGAGLAGGLWGVWGWNGVVALGATAALGVAVLWAMDRRRS